MDCATVAERLADARNAYHMLMTGRSANIIVDQNGERVQYTAANRGDLAQYITLLEREANACGLLKTRPARRFALGLKLG